MSITKSERVKVLIEALPYIQKYRGEIVVIKYGGNVMTNDELKNSVMSDIVLLSMLGIKVVLVHGGGPEINKLLNRVGKKSEFVDGLRVTDKETVNVVQMVLAGKVSKDLVKLIGSHGGKGIGLSGIDGNMIKASAINSKLGYVGKVDEINPQIVCDVLEKGYIPVISTIGVDEKENVYNINADTVASKIAGVLKAESLILMTDIKGVLKDVSDESSLMTEVHVNDAPLLIQEGIVSGGMIPKIDCCIEAIRQGATKVFITDGRLPHSILIEMLTDEGVGTMFMQ